VKDGECIVDAGKSAKGSTQREQASENSNPFKLTITKQLAEFP